jgi:hypothetical protein
MTVVARVVTPVTMETVAPLLERGLVLIGEASKNLGEMLLAQIWLEQSGRPWNWNFGNITASEDYPTIWRPPWYDKAEAEATTDPARRARYLALHEDMLAGKAPKAFRAYDSAEAGMTGYLEHLRKAAPDILRAGKTGDPRKFAEAIRSSGYTPDLDVSAATKTLSGIVEKARKLDLFKLGAAGAGIEVLFLLGGAAWLWWRRKR